MQLFRILRLLPLVALLFGTRASADQVVRIMAGNLSTGTQDYDDGEGSRIFKGLQPDIALVQEWNYLSNTPADIRTWVDTNFGVSFSYFREAGAGIPNGIVSRYPILSAGEWADDDTLSDRDFVWAKIDVPGDKDLWAISVHLKASSGAANVTRRDGEAKQLLDLIALHVPASDYLVIGGDFNTYSRTEACINTLSAQFVTAGPWPADQAGDADTNHARAEAYDWVIPDPDLNALKTALVIDGKTFPNGLVFDSRVTTPFSFLPSPILSSDSSPTEMQHMGVMRAFLIPTPPANTGPTIASVAKTSSSETSPDLYQIVRSASTGLSVTATDDAGESSLKYTWSKTSGPASAVSFSANGTNAAKNCTATFQAAGDYTLSVTVQDVPGLSVASAVKVRVVQTAGSVTLNPATATLAVNATLAFTATVIDQFNQPMAGQPASFTWSAGGSGTFNAAGILTATTAGGPYVVTASSSGFSKTSTVTVTPGTATISLVNLSQTYDGNPKPISATTSPQGLAVTILYAGSSTPPTNAGSYPVSASVSGPNFQGSSSATLVIMPDEWKFWKNSHFSVAEQSEGLAADHADPDSDGLSNLVEYALGSDPRASTTPPAAVLDGNVIVLTFFRPAGLPGIHYAAESSVDFETWLPVPLEITVPGGIETVRATEPLNVATGVRFLRLRIERE